MNSNQKELDRLLGDLSASQPPPLPAGFQQAVWRQIRRRRADGAPARDNPLNWFFNAILRPQPIVAALTLALVLGACAGLGSFAGPAHPVRLDAFTVSATGWWVSAGK
ncbi:MAG: hypothetical protein LBK76_09680 [Verrucomicrobiales bacterium]|nr:hypothetical protein [Verrucomicrobiales bacterium]